MSKKQNILIPAVIAIVLYSIPASAETVYFLVAEANQVNPPHGDSYVLPLTGPNDIAHARDLVQYGVAAGQPIVSANIAHTGDAINRDYFNPVKQLWSWHVTQFIAFADTTEEIFNGWPGGVEQGSTNTGNEIGFWSYTVVAELGTDPKHWDRDFVPDDHINYKDFAVLAQHWLSSCGSPDWCGGADLDKNGIVDNNDLKVFTEAWLSLFATWPQWPPRAWNCPTQCHGDADCATELIGKTQYSVGNNDLNILMMAMGPFGEYDPRADFNRDGKVDADDQAIFYQWYEQTDVPADCPTEP